MEISGILTKQGQKMKTWRRRHFELHYNRLCYYLYDGGPMKGEFLIDEKTTLHISNLKRHGFSLVQKNGKTLNMFADNAIDKERWMNTLLKIINRVKLTTRPTSASVSASASSVEKSLSTIIEMKDPIQEDHSQIFVHIIQAKDLAQKGSTDTYAKVRVDGDCATTRIVKKELNPVWDEHFEFLWTSDLRFVRIEVWSDDPMHSSRDNFLGVVYIPILSLQPNSVNSHWYKLGKRSTRSNISGEIKVSVSCNRAPDPYVLNVLRDIQKIPELQTKASDLLRLGSLESESPKIQFEGKDLDLFPALLPPPQTEFSEDLSLRVTFKPTLDKSTFASVEGILLLTNYRVIFVSHSRIAFAEEAVPNIQNRGMSEEFTCSIPLAMITSLNIQAYYDNNSCQYEDAITMTTNDSRVMKHTLYEFFRTITFR